MNFKEWKYVEAATFCLKVADGTHDSPKRHISGKPLITSKHIKGRSIDFESAYFISLEDFTKINLRSKVDQWDVLISMIGEYCGYCYVERNSKVDYAVKNVGIFKTGSKLKAEWIYYYLNSPEGRATLASLKSGTSQPYISLGALRQLQILIPNEKKVMSEITSILSSLDEKIELNRQTNQTLEAIAQTFFKELCVPVNNELAKGWKVGTMGEIFELQRGFDLPASTRTNGKYPVIAASGFNGFHNEYKNKAHGVTTGRSGVLGNVFYIQEPFWALNTSLFVKDFKIGHPIFTFFLLKTIDLKSYNGGSAVPTLNRSDVHKIEVVIPPISNINRFSAFAKDVFELIHSNEKEIQSLINIRDSLLPKLMKGEITIKLNDK